jgi:iron-sulfur cluster protein
VKPFASRYWEAVADEGVASGLLAFQRSWQLSRDAQIGELEELTGRSFDQLRAELAETKRDVLANWQAYLDEFTRNAEAAGSTVVRVADAAQACAYIEGLCARHGSELVVKGKSMVSEEVGLNDALEAEGIVAVETDLGEWLLQLAEEHPSHLVMPAIHKRADEIAALLTRVLGREFAADDIPGMVASVRIELRDRFLAARVGLSGANALVAADGAAMIVCNEGNNRMSVALPPVHVVTVGAEKLVPSMAEAIAQVRLLGRSATGQAITTYTNFVTGPRAGGEQHIVVVDNGRSAMAADPDFAQALGCIRCGACANVCPPYQVVGGHAFGYVYTGAIGLVNTPFHHGLDAAAGPQSLCVSCGACATVCPADIPLPDQILKVRHQVAEARGLSWSRRMAFAGLRSRRMVAAGAALAGVVSAPLRRDGVTRLPQRLASVPAVARHVGWRSPPAIPSVPARARVARASAPAPLANTGVSGRRVTVFLQCVADRLMPPTASGAVALLQAAGATVQVPDRQHCCGLPAFDGGDLNTARAMAKATIGVLEGADDVVTPASSCVVAMTHEYPQLLADEPDWQRRAQALASRVHDLVDYLAGPARLPTAALDTGDRTPVTVHRFCQSQNTMGMRAEMEDVLRDVCRVPVRPLEENGVCCGFGGSTSITAPEVAAGIVERKLACADATDSGTLITNNPGCALHMRGAADASDRALRVATFAEYLAERLAMLAPQGRAG